MIVHDEEPVNGLALEPAAIRRDPGAEAGYGVLPRDRVHVSDSPFVAHYDLLSRASDTHFAATK
jgi:hypothetical protein